METQPVKTRFAPSPTGRLHLGNLRTALFNALLARHHGGTLLLRIEDTDRNRSRDEHVQDLMQDLRWLGLEWQEGPEADGEQGPYHQSEREAVYQRYYQQLEAAGLVYPCYCSEQELKLSRRAQLSAGQAPRYSGTCRELSAEQRQARAEQGRQPTLRFRVPTGEEVRFDDLVRGPQRFASDDIGDFIIRRADGTPAFFFSNAVDDALMQVSHVLRGEDHLTNTPRQLLLLQALDLPAPHYGHISMIVGADGSPLSKRHGSRSLAELREAGYLPQAILNYLARLGHHYADDSFMSLEALAAGFRIESLGRAPARYDEQQLDYWQAEAVNAADTSQLWQWMTAAVADRVPEDQREGFVEAVRPNVRRPAEAAEWAEVLYGEPPQADAEGLAWLAQAGPGFFDHALAALQSAGGDGQGFMNELKQRSGAKGKGLFMPLRIALTGHAHGPQLGPVLELIGEARARERLALARQRAKSED